MRTHLEVLSSFDDLTTTEYWRERVLERQRIGERECWRERIGEREYWRERIGERENWRERELERERIGEIIG
jgi:hypothetical protein